MFGYLQGRTELLYSAHRFILKNVYTHTCLYLFFQLKYLKVIFTLHEHLLLNVYHVSPTRMWDIFLHNHNTLLKLKKFNIDIIKLSNIQIPSVVPIPLYLWCLISSNSEHSPSCLSFFLSFSDTDVTWRGASSVVL